MIARIWHGRTKTGDAEVYRRYVIETGIKALTSTAGNLGAQIWQRQEGTITHIWVISWWHSFENIKTFAGHEIERARYYDDDKKYLLEFEPDVIHCDSFDFPSQSK